MALTCYEEEMKDESVIAYASGGAALIGFSFHGDRNKKRQLLDVPKKCSLMGPTQSSTEYHFEFESKKQCQQYSTNVRENSFSINPKASWFPFVGLEVGTSSSQQRGSENVSETMQKEVCIVSATYVPMRSFRIPVDQMHLTKEAEDEALLIDSPEKAKQFLSKYNSHIVDGIYDLGGVFYRGVSITTTKAVQKELLIDAAKKTLELEVKFPIICTGAEIIGCQYVGLNLGAHSHNLFSKSQRTSRKTCTSETFSFMLGPTAKDVAEFHTKILTDKSKWHIIHHSNNGFVPVWELMIRSGKKDMIGPANMIRQEWQSSVASIAQLNPQVLEMLRQSKIDITLPASPTRDDAKEQLLKLISKFPLTAFEAGHPSKAVQLLRNVWETVCQHKSTDLRIYLFDQPNFVNLIEYIAKSTDRQTDSGKEFIRQILDGKLLETCTSMLSPCVLELLKKPVEPRRSLQKRQIIKPNDLPQYLQTLLEEKRLEGLQNNIEKAIQDCVAQSDKVKDVVKKHGFGEDGYWEGLETFSEDVIKGIINDLQEEITPFKEVPTMQTFDNFWSLHQLEGTSSISKVTKYKFIGDIVVDRKLPEKGIKKLEGKRIIDCLRHRIQPFCSSMSKDDDNQEITGGTSIEILIQIMENSSFLAQIAMCKLLLEQRFAVPLIFPSGIEDSKIPLLQIVDALRTFQVTLGKQEMLCLAEDTKFFRVVFISNKHKDVTENADMAKDVTQCNFVSFYDTETSSDSPIVEIGVGFIPDKNDNNMHVPCISMHILGDYSKLTTFITSFANLIIEETEEHNKGISGSCKWGTSPKRFSERNGMFLGTRGRVKDRLLELVSEELDKFQNQREGKSFKNENDVNLQAMFLKHEFAPVHIYPNLKMFQHSISRKDLVLQQSFQQQAEAYFRLLATNQSTDQETQQREFVTDRNRRAILVNKLDVIQHFVDVLNIRDATQRVLGVLEFQVSIKKNNEGAVERAEEEKNRLFELFLSDNQSNSSREKYRAAQREYVDKILNLEHLWRELGHIYISDPCKQNHLPKLAALHLLDGFPLEILDGDAAMFSKLWVSKILDELDSILKKPKVFVLSVMGLQSSGKSTLLNLMFGTQLRTGAGQCTRGVYLQLVKSERTEYQYVLVIDTEGIRAPEYFGLENSEAHDNRLATFAILPADACIILVSNEDDNGLKEVLPVVMLAFKRSKIGADGMKSKVFFLYRSIDTNEAKKLQSSRQKLQEYLREAAQQVSSGSPHLENCNVSSYLDFNISDNEEKSDVKYLGSLKKCNTPPDDIPNWEYGEKVMKIREYIHTRITEGYWQARTLVEWDNYLGSVWDCICTSNFELRFKCLMEYWSHEKLQRKMSECRQQVARKWTEVFQSSEGMEISQKKSKDLWLGIVRGEVDATIEEYSKKVKSLLQESQWQKWRTEEEKTWASFLSRTEEQWGRKIQDCIDGVLQFENSLNKCLQDIKQGIDDMFANATENILISKDQDEASLKDMEEKHFDPLFNSILQEAKEQFRPVANDVGRLVNLCYDRAKLTKKYNLTRDIDMPNSQPNKHPKKLGKVVNAIIGKGVGSLLGVPESKTLSERIGVETLDSTIRSCLKDVKQYTDYPVERVIEATNLHISESMGRLNKDEEAWLHIYARALVIRELKVKQEAWDNDHNVAGMLTTKKDELREFFRNRVEGLCGTDMFLSEMKNIFKSNWLECFTSDVLLGTFCTSIQTKPWVYDWKFWRAKLDLHLIRLMNDGNIDDMLHFMANGDKHSNHVLNIELKSNWFSERDQQRLWEEFTDNFEASWTMAIGSVGENKSIKRLFEELRSGIHQRTKSSELAKLLDAVNYTVYEKYEIDYKKVAFQLHELMKTCFKHQNLEGYLLESVKEQMNLLENESARPRCQVKCQRCGVACFHQAGHDHNHDTCHQPIGLAGICWDSNGELVAESCSRRQESDGKFFDNSVLWSYKDFDKAYKGWAIPTVHPDSFSSELREYAFFHYQKNLVSLHHNAKICTNIPPEYNHDINLIQSRLQKLTRQFSGSIYL